MDIYPYITPNDRVIDKILDVYNVVLTFYLTFISISVGLFGVIVSMKSTILRVYKVNPSAAEKIIKKFKYYLIFLLIVSITFFASYLCVVFYGSLDTDFFIKYMIPYILGIILFFVIFLLETVYQIFHIFMTILNKYMEDK
jgi:hypothetical protein